MKAVTAVSAVDAETVAAAIAAVVSVADAAEASATDNFTIRSLNLYIIVCLNGHTFFCFNKKAPNVTTELQNKTNIFVFKKFVIIKIYFH